jgi:hypothetical protein
MIHFVLLLLSACSVSHALPAPASVSGPAAITVYDASYLWSTDMSNSDAHEHMQLLAALGGLVNRDAPQLFVAATASDSTWLDFLRQPGQWLENATVTPESSIVTLVSKFADFYSGVVMYDGGVPASSNVASSLAGIENLLPLLSGGVLQGMLCESGPMLAVQKSLVGMFTGSVTGSSKVDAYQWFIDNYMQQKGQGSSGVNPAVHGYLMDYWWALNSNADADRLNVAVLNADFVIAKKGILWDLDVWPDTAPNDDPAAALGLDYEMLRSLLLQAYRMLDGAEMIHVAGFTPWAFKYVIEDGVHGGVATEWQTSKVLSAYNAFVDADACCELNTFSNSAFYMHYPLPSKFEQNPLPTMDDLKAMGYLTASGDVVPKNYISFYVGDYDSAAWAFNELKGFWDDPNRGAVPLGWAVNPVLAIRFPPIFDYMYSTLRPNDRLTTGDSGAGYVNPTQLLPPRDVSGLPSGRDVWVAHCEKWYTQMDMTFTGFLINGAAGVMTKEAEAMYSSFSPHGGTEQTGYAPDNQGVHMQNRMPFFQESDIPADVSTAVETILSQDVPGTLQFHVYRSILQSPTYHLNVVNNVHAQSSNAEFVDPIVLSMLASSHL